MNGSLFFWPLLFDHTHYTVIVLTIGGLKSNSRICKKGDISLMSSTIEIGNLLFQNKQVDLVILPGFKLGMVCPAGTATSPRRTGSSARPYQRP